MKSPSGDVLNLQAQLAEKNDLVMALTSQLERTATQLDRLQRAGIERQGSSGGAPAGAGLNPELSGKLGTALDQWEESQPLERIGRIEEGIDQILDLLKSQSAAPVTAASPTEKSPAATKAASNQDFWEAAKARILGESPAAAPAPVFMSTAAPAAASPVVEEEIGESIFTEIGDAPQPPAPVSTIHDVDELLAAVKSRDTYIQYLTSRLRLAESRKYLPVSWDLLNAAPDNFRSRLESLEVLLKDQLRQAEVAHSLERALLGRERAKLAHIKQNLEIQIKKMALPITASPPPSPPAPAPSAADAESRAEPEGRWKRIFSR